ncbi:MAG: DUF2142 domain-containing protein [Thermoanaerobaculia bacterium]
MAIGRANGSLVAALLTLAFAAPLVWLVPPGEAPDEPAHLAYVDHLLRHGELPPVGPNEGYENYQPPLAYLAMAAGVAVSGHASIDYPFVRDPSFQFAGPKKRMFLPVDDDPGAVHSARAANLLGGAIASAATFLLCLRLASSAWIAVAAAAPFCLAPQLLFASATATNDALLAALSALALLTLARVLEAASGPAAAGASASAGLAFGAKASAAALAPAIVFAGIVLALRRRWREVGFLLVPAAVLTTGWVTLNLARAGTIVPRLPTGWESAHAGTLARLMTEPWWIVQVWVGFWAKLGWFNVPLPMAAYLLFVPATMLAAAGLTACLSRRDAAALALVVVANAALLVVYLLTVDWQPQGRYLLPSLPALAGLATIGLERVRPRRDRAFAIALLAFALAAAILTLRQAAIVY